MTKQEKIQSFKDYMFVAFIGLTRANMLIDGSGPIEELIVKFEEVQEEVVKALQK